MCCFSTIAAPVSLLSRLFSRGRAGIKVSDTSIFARMASPEAQLLVYSMTLSVGSDVAMILPVPTPPSAPEDALTFVDLSKYPLFFGDLAQLFEVAYPAQRSGGFTPRFAPKSRTLTVHKVGSFVASFVPRRDDFHRLEPRFRLPDDVWDALPDARDFGFAVFQLQPGHHAIHPMAFRFRTRDPSRLFFPTVHVHDGTVHPEARFDHALYYQHPRVTELSTAPVLPIAFEGAHVSFLTPGIDYEGTVARGQPLLRRTLRGRLPNRDTYVRIGADA